MRRSAAKCGSGTQVSATYEDTPAKIGATGCRVFAERDYTWPFQPIRKTLYGAASSFGENLQLWQIERSYSQIR